MSTTSVTPTRQNPSKRTSGVLLQLDFLDSGFGGVLAEGTKNSAKLVKLYFAITLLVEERESVLKFYKALSIHNEQTGADDDTVVPLYEHHTMLFNISSHCTAYLRDPAALLVQVTQSNFNSTGEKPHPHPVNMVHLADSTQLKYTYHGRSLASLKIEQGTS